MENTELNESMRQGFKKVNRFMLLMWRLGLGPWLSLWPEGTGRYLVINHTGRKSGIRYQTPVNYAVVDGEIYVVAGFGGISDWYRNLKSNPDIEIWLADGWWAGKAEEVHDPARRMLILRQILINSGFASRLLAGIDPNKISDEELDRVTSDYRLIRLKRKEARTGPGGPGELAWIWPLATFLLLPLLFRKRRR